MACLFRATTGSLEVLKLLLERVSNGNACSKWQEMLLLIAANSNYHDAVDALLKHGADPFFCSEAR